MKSTPQITKILINFLAHRAHPSVLYARGRHHEGVAADVTLPPPPERPLRGWYSQLCLLQLPVSRKLLNFRNVFLDSADLKITEQECLPSSC